MRAPLIAVLVGLAVPLASEARFASESAEARCLKELEKEGAKRLGRLGPGQAARYPGAVVAILKDHASVFDEARVDRFLADLGRRQSFVAVLEDRERWDEEFDAEMAFTRERLEVWVEKDELTETQRKEIRKQSEALDARTAQVLAGRLAGADASPFRRVYADLKSARGLQDSDPIAQLARLHRARRTAARDDPFDPAFRRPLTEQELESIPAAWEETLRRLESPETTAASVASWRKRAEQALQVEDAVKRLAAEESVLDAMAPTFDRLGYDISRTVKAAMESPPSEERKRALDAMRLRSLREQGTR